MPAATASAATLLLLSATQRRLKVCQSKQQIVRPSSGLPTYRCARNNASAWQLQRNTRIRGMIVCQGYVIDRAAANG